MASSKNLILLGYLISCALWLGVSADLTVAIGSSTSSVVKCSTQMGNAKPKTPIPTTTSTTTLPTTVLFVIAVSTPVKTITGSLSTSKSTVPYTTTVTTTNAAVTGTFSTTSTIVSTATTTTDTTVFTTSTTTTTITSTSTTTIPTPAGFTPIYDSSGRRNFGDPARRRRDAREVDTPLLDKKTYPASPAMYPKSVKCVKSVQVTYFKKIIIVKPTVTRTVPGSTTTVKSTTTYTSTSTVVPPGVTNTSTFTTTSATTSTITNTVTVPTTTTQTETFIQPTTTYAACATNNILGPRLSNGNYLNFNFNPRDPEANYNYLTAPNQYECCVPCITSPNNCEFSAYYPGEDETCVNIENVYTCPAQPFEAGGFQERVDDTGVPIYFSNGPCGELVSDGVVTP